MDGTIVMKIKKMTIADFSKTLRTPFHWKNISQHKEIIQKKEIVVSEPTILGKGSRNKQLRIRKWCPHWKRRQSDGVI